MKNLNELAKNMTDEEVYEMSKGILDVLVSRKPIIKQIGLERDDILNNSFTYFYDKQSRGKESPLTLKNTITKSHLKNLLYLEFSNAINYQIRMKKNQNTLNNISFEQLNDDLNHANALAKLEKNIKDLEGKTNEIEDEVENQVEKEKLFSYISKDVYKNYFIKQTDLHGKAIYKNLSYRKLAHYYYDLNKKTKVSVKDLEDIVYFKHNNVYTKVDKKGIRELMKDFKEHVSLNLYNNEIKGEVYDS